MDGRPQDHEQMREFARLVNYLLSEEQVRIHEAQLPPAWAHEAEDLILKAAADVSAAIQRGMPWPEHLESFLRKCIRHEINDRYRHYGARKRRSGDHRSVEDRLFRQDIEHLQGEVSGVIAKTILLRAKQVLKPINYRIFYLMYWDERSLEEIALALGWKKEGRPNAEKVKSRLARARMEVRRVCQDLMDGDGGDDGPGGGGVRLAFLEEIIERSSSVARSDAGAPASRCNPGSRSRSKAEIQAADLEATWRTRATDLLQVLRERARNSAHPDRDFLEHVVSPSMISSLTKGKNSIDEQTLADDFRSSLINDLVVLIWVETPFPPHSRELFVWTAARLVLERRRQGLDPLLDSSFWIDVERTRALLRALDDCVLRLPPSLRSVASLRLYERLSHSAIARRLRITPNATRSRWGRARQSLRAALTERELDVDRLYTCVLSSRLRRVPWGRDESPGMRS